MPLISHYNLPSFKRLKDEGETILSKHRATKQEIRELHIGLLNMMPDNAIEATERQFFRVIGHSNEIAQFYMHPFSLSKIKRSKKAQEHIDKYYKTFEQIKEQGLDALIITGANIKTQPEEEPFYEQLKEVIEWSYKNVTSTLYSCLATHIVMNLKYKQKRHFIGKKCWGVFSHKVIEKTHPLVNGVNTRFDVPHSRFNEIKREQFIASDMKILAESSVGVHLAVSSDLLRMILFQGHPEYDTISLLKEYKREIQKYIKGEIKKYPPMPENYLGKQAKAILKEYKNKLKTKELSLEDFPENIIAKNIDNTWHDTATAIINNWVGCVYQTTHKDIKKPFMDSINPDDPLNLKNK